MRPGEIVLVHGASGGVGIPTVLLALEAGATVIATAGTESGRALVRELGAHHVLDHRDPNHLAAVPDITGGAQVDLIVEMLADQNLEMDAAILANGGRVVVVGSRGSVHFTPRLLMVREADVRGTAIWNMTAAQKAESLTAVGKALAAGLRLPAAGVVFPLADAAGAHRHIRQQRALGKCILDCS